MRNHLYRHFEYVTIPIIDKNSEYHNRVSPRVRRGGRSSFIHRIEIKTASNNVPTTDNIIGREFTNGFLDFISKMIIASNQKLNIISAKILKFIQFTFCFFIVLFFLFCQSRIYIQLQPSS